MPTEKAHNGWLILPHISVHNASCISSPLTWGFPSPTAFIGLMWALQRSMPRDSGLTLLKIGIICHSFTPFVSSDDYIRRFHLTRNPLNKNGTPDTIIEEGRANFTISLVFSVHIDQDFLNSEEELQHLAVTASHTLNFLKIAGGHPSWTPKINPILQPAAEPHLQYQQFFTLCRQARLIPGFALISKPQLLKQRQAELSTPDKQASLIEAFLDLCRLNQRPKHLSETDPNDISWEVVRPHKGWIVPISIGYASLSPPYPPGHVKNARSSQTSFTFTEAVYSFAEWRPTHRIFNPHSILWNGTYSQTNNNSQVYLATNIQPNQQKEW